MTAVVRNPHAVVRLARHMVERTYPGATPTAAITAPLPADKPQDPDKGLLAQRDAYFRQSAATVAGRVAPYESTTRSSTR